MILDRPHRHQPGTVRQRLAAVVATVVVGGGLVLGLPALGAAQADGTGAATPPPPTDCQIVIAGDETAESTPTPPAAATPAAAPIASPVADGATPVASPVIIEPADPDAPLRDELAATAETLFGCLNERNFEVYAQLTSDAYRGQLFGSQEPLTPEQFVILAQSLADIDNRIIELTDLERDGDDRASVQVTYVSAYQQRTGIWTFARTEVDGLSAWVLQDEELVTTAIPEGAGEIDLTIEDDGYTLEPEAVTANDLVLNLANPTANDHEALVLLLDEGVTTDALLQNTSAALPEGITLIGQSTVLAGDEGTMVLTDLAPGTYTIVDLFPDENGIPYLSLGLTATFTVDN